MNKKRVAVICVETKDSQVRIKITLKSNTLKDILDQIRLAAEPHIFGNARLISIYFYNDEVIK
jgi:hypothetical protein